MCVGDLHHNHLCDEAPIDAAVGTLDPVRICGLDDETHGVIQVTTHLARPIGAERVPTTVTRDCLGNLCYDAGRSTWPPKPTVRETPAAEPSRLSGAVLYDGDGV